MVQEDWQYRYSELVARLADLEVRLRPNWINDSSRNPILQNETTRGNATVASYYRINNGECRWTGAYVLGSTTSWTAGALALLLPVTPDMTPYPGVGGIAVGNVKAYNGTPWLGGPDMTSTAINPYSHGGSFWSNLVPFTWASTHQLVWDILFKV